MTFAAKMDFSLILVIDVARELFGPEGRERSTSVEKHFPDHGGLFVNIEKNRWYSHVNEKGGDATSLVQFATGCDFQAAAAWLRSRGYIPGQPTTLPPCLVCTYDYCDEQGKPLYHVDRHNPKAFRQWRVVGGERVNGVVAGTYERSKSGGAWCRVKGSPRLNSERREFPGIRCVPYRLPELLQGEESAVLIPGGEKDVDNLRALGFSATCNHGGEGKGWPELSHRFKDRHVFLLCDNDVPGEKHQAIVGAALKNIAADIRVVRFPELPRGGDVSDFIELRLKDGVDDEAIRKELAERLSSAPAWEQKPVPEELPKLSKPAFGSFDSEQDGGDFSENWPEPLSLPDGLSPVATFDAALLPEKIAPWVCDISERMQCPPDYVAVAALVALGSVLGRKIGIAPQQRTDWFEVPNLWGCIVGRPGSMKSPAINEALKPLHRLEIKAREAHDLDLAEHEKAKAVWKLRRDAAESRASAALKKDPSASVNFDLAEPEDPAERRYITNDTTYEKLGEIHAQNPNGILAHRDELVSLLKTLDREEYAAARGFYLTGWNGTSPYKFDRIMRGKTHIEAVCLSMLGSTQPGRLAEYVRRAVSGGAGDDGLIQRFGLLVWPDQSPEWKDVDCYPDTAARNAAWETFDSFDRLSPEAIGAETIPYQTVPILRLDIVAHGLFSEWRAELECRLRSADLHPALEAHLAKYRKLVPALALINHLADDGVGPVNEAALLRALSLAEYLETHARRAYGAGPEAETAAAKSILAHIRKGDLSEGFTLRDVCRQQWSSLTDRGQAQAGLHLLCDLDWIAAIDAVGAPTGGRPTTRYAINPRALK